MNIAVNGKSLAAKEPGGAVRIALRLLQELAICDPTTTFEIFVPVSCWEDLLLLNELTYPNIILRPQLCKLFRYSILRAFWEQCLFPMWLRRHAPFDLILNLTNTAPVLQSSSIPQVLLLHDVGFLNLQWFSRAFAAYLKWGLQRAIAQRVYLITVSHASAMGIQSAFPNLTASIEVIWNGVDQPPEKIQPCSLDYDYILFIGSQNPRKNLAGAIAAFQLFRQQYSANLHLVIVGATKKIFTPATDPLQLNEQMERQVTFMGYVEDAIKWSLLKGAKLLLLPVFMEGFGLPVAEALLMYTPVVISDIPVFHELFEQEQFSDLVEYVNPHSPDDIARGINVTLQRKALTQDPSLNQPSLKDTFPWYRSANQYFNFFRTICKT